MRKFIIGIDVGGTKVAGGLVTRKGKLSHAQVVPTYADKGFDKSHAQITHLIGRLVRAAGGKENVGGIGICAPGPLNPKTGVVLNPPNLPGWRDIDLTKLVEKEFGLPAKLENDANAAGLAEVLFGAAVGYKDVFYVTVSTGIGTGDHHRRENLSRQEWHRGRRRPRLHRLSQPLPLRVRNLWLY